MLVRYYVLLLAKLSLDLLQFDLGCDGTECYPDLVLVLGCWFGREVEQERGQQGRINRRAELGLVTITILN